MSSIRLAMLYDGVHPSAGPYFSADHPRIEASEDRDGLLGYLRAGAALLSTTALGRDVQDPARGRRVPLGYRTDGVWVWSEAAVYYLEAHGLAPDPALCAAIRRCGYRCPAPDRPAVLGVLDAFYAEHAASPAGGAP